MKQFIYLLAACLLALSCKKNNTDDSFTQPAEHLTGVPPLSGMLDRSKLTMTSVIQVDLDRNIARVPLFKGTFNGNTVWYVRMDVSDSALAKTLGLNFAPRLVNADNGCPGCIQTVKSLDPVLGKAAVVFAGTVDFSPMRVLIPGPTGFPPLMAQPGSIAGPGYSDLVRLEGSNAVYNAPIIATGDGPFDVSPTHTNTLDRVMAMDIQAMTVDLQFIRAFSHGKEIFYFTFGSTAALSATLERGTFVPALATIPFANDDQNPKGARSAIFTFANGKVNPGDPNSQGLAHVILDNPPGNLSLQNPALLESLRKLGDAHNVLGSFPTLTDKRLRELYTPLWDLNIAVWSDDAVARKVNFAQTDANTIRQLSVGGFVTNPGGAKLSSANFLVNCPVLGFATTPPTEDQAPRPDK
ncbi:MAG: DUF7482 domain-containing protein [Chitinophagaceae bacterium]